MFGAILDVTTAGVLLVSSVEATDAAKPLKCTGQPPTTQNCLSQNVGQDKVENPWWFINKNHLCK